MPADACFVAGAHGVECPQAAERVFADFLYWRTLAADQGKFFALDVHHPTVQRVMHFGLSHARPFTTFEANGVEQGIENADIVRLMYARSDITRPRIA